MISFYINRRAFLVLLLSLICFHQVVRCNKAFDKHPKLQFTKDGKFKIVIFADLHYGENAWEDWGPEQDRNSDKAMSYILDTERPEFVVYLGDLLTANNMATANATKYWKQATSPAEKRNIPYASVFGNHDDMAFEWPLEWFGNSGIPQASPGQYVYFEGTSRAKLMDNENSGLSLSSSGPKSLWPGVSNYALRICSHKDPRSTAAILYFLDSGGGSYPQVISAAQVAWFKELSTNLNPLNKTQEFIFWHIPSKAYESVAPKIGAQIAAPCVGSINKEAVASQAAEWGIMDFLTNRPSAKAVVVGHNHGLDWCCPHGSLWLCFARHSGYGGYGSWTRGARVIELSEYPTQAAKTWIRLEDGSAVGSFQMAGHIQMAT